MRVTISPSSIKGTITAPASKSAMQRACAAALLKGGKTILHNPGVSQDDQAALEIIRQLGAHVNHTNGTTIIESNGIRPISDTIHCGESGLSVRLFTSIAALSNQPIKVTGSGSLLKRPLSFFNETLPQLHVKVNSNDGLLPLQIKGPLQPKDIVIDGSLSSQFLTGLLFAYAAANASDKTITVTNLNSKPYIDLTLRVMADFGLKTPVHTNYEAFYFGKQSITSFANQSIQYSVEGDWSGGAFLLVAAAIAGDIIVHGLDPISTQADKAILQALQQSGADLVFENDQIIVRKAQLKSFHFNATDCPDLFPPLVALAAYAEGTTVIEGAHRLTHKESNRALTLQQEFGKMGVTITFRDDSLLVNGNNRIKGAAVHSHHDHRIAMACAVAALKADGDTIIEGAEAVNKSYPGFWDHMLQLHTSLHKQD